MKAIVTFTNSDSNVELFAHDVSMKREEMMANTDRRIIKWYKEEDLLRIKLRRLRFVDVGDIGMGVKRITLIDRKLTKYKLFFRSDETISKRLVLSHLDAASNYVLNLSFAK